jgi:hypothetical protein
MYEKILLLVLIVSLVIVPTINEAYAKGLKVYLTVDSNQAAQDASVGTYQYGDRVSEEIHYINNGITEITLQYREGAIENGDFQICVAIHGLQRCATGHDSEEKKPEHVRVSLQTGDPTPIPAGGGGNDQAQSQSSKNENNNNNENSLSQSQATTIYICKENGCVAQ